MPLITSSSSSSAAVCTTAYSPAHSTRTCAVQYTTRNVITIVIKVSPEGGNGTCMIEHETISTSFGAGSLKKQREGRGRRNGDREGPCCNMTPATLLGGYFKQYYGTKNGDILHT